MKDNRTSMQLIKDAAKRLKACELKNIADFETNHVLDLLLKKLGLKNQRQVILLVSIFENSFKNTYTDLDDIANFLNCSTLDIAEFSVEIEDMQKAGYLVEKTKIGMREFHQSYLVTNSVISSIVNNTAINTNIYSEIKEFDKYELCMTISQYVDDMNCPISATIKYLTSKETEFENIEFIKDICQAIPNVEDRILFYVVCNDFLGTHSEGGGKSLLTTTLSEIYERTSQRIACRKSLHSGQHYLVRNNLVICNSEYIFLTEEGEQLFFGEDADSFSKPKTNLDRYAFTKMLYDYTNDDAFDKDYALSLVNLKLKVINVERQNLHLRFITDLSSYVQSTDDRLLYYMTCHKCVMNDNLDLLKFLGRLYTPKVCTETMRKFKNGTHVLLKSKLVELNNNKGLFGDETYLRCTDKGKKLFFEEDADLYEEEICADGIIIPSETKEKHLYFSNELESQLDMLQKSLQEDIYQSLKQRLKSKALPSGIAILLYGLPGTGKTESALQIAKATGRSIMKVDISATKSAWFGESEKIIKKVFTDYKRLCSKSVLTPILLFNEADAVLAKRKEGNSGNVAQTENAIQNIILDEMENLDGILIATTNLANNLDGAFERRFLFKIRFDKPTIEAVQSIWVDKLPSLQPNEAKELANSYDFSGGEIDNIVRKAMIREVIAGEVPTISTLHEYCKEERISNKNFAIPIGFR